MSHRRRPGIQSLTHDLRFECGCSGASGACCGVEVDLHVVLNSCVGLSEGGGSAKLKTESQVSGTFHAARPGISRLIIIAHRC